MARDETEIRASRAARSRRHAGAAAGARRGRRIRMLPSFYLSGDKGAGLERRARGGLWWLHRRDCRAV